MGGDDLKLYPRKICGEAPAV